MVAGRRRAMAEYMTSGIRKVANRLSPQEIITNSETFGLCRQRPNANNRPTIHTATVGNETAH